VAPEDALFSIAEISIGLAGFSGLVAAFVQHPGQTWRPDQKARIVFLILLSFGMIVAALAPYALSGISNSPAVIWGPPMIGFPVLCLILLGYWGVLSRRHGFTLLFPQVSIPVMLGSITLQILALLSGLGLVLPYSPAVFVFALLSVLIFGANMFLALLYSIWE